MTDTEQIREQYEKMYAAMIRKDSDRLSAVLDGRFILLHMTGLRQSKAEFIGSVMDGTLNYYSARHENISVAINGKQADLDGRSYVSAAVFGGGRGNWRLRQRIALEKTNGVWLMTQSVASIY